MKKTASSQGGGGLHPLPQDLPLRDMTLYAPFFLIALNETTLQLYKRKQLLNERIQNATKIVRLITLGLLISKVLSDFCSLYEMYLQQLCTQSELFLDHSFPNKQVQLGHHCKTQFEMTVVICNFLALASDYMYSQTGLSLVLFVISDHSMIIILIGQYLIYNICNLS